LLKQGTIVPKFPAFADKISRIKNAVFEKYRDKMLAYGPEMIRLHIGDTYQAPLYNIPISEQFINTYPDFNRYCNTFGIKTLRKQLADKLNRDNHFQVHEDHILISAGATNALSAALHTILDNADEILVLTPCWPIFPGLVNAVPAKMVEVPFYCQADEGFKINIEEYLSGYLSPRTSAIYLNSPNNPSGTILTRDQLIGLGRFAAKHGLWILSDEAYDGLTYDNNQDICIAALPGFFERTISVFTFSKLYMFAGLRLGYAVAAGHVIQNMNKTMVHQLYSPSTFAQQMMIQPVETRYKWMEKVREHYQTLRNIFFENIGIIQNLPQAGYFVFFSIEPYIGTRTYNQIIGECLEKGVSVAPGNDFGKGFEYYIRICFTGEPADKLEMGAKILKKILIG